MSVQKQQRTTIKRVIRTLVIGTSITLAGVILTILLGGLLLINSETVRVKTTLATVNFLNESNDLKITIKGLHSPDFQQWQMEKLTLTRQDKPLLTIDQLNLQWRPAALLNKTLHIDRLHASRIDVFQIADKRNPVLPEQKTPGGTLPLVGARLQSLSVDKLSLHELITNHSNQAGIEHIIGDGDMVFRINGQGNWQQGAPLIFHINARNFSEKTARFSIQSRSHNRQSTHMLGKVEEAPGGIFGQLLHLPTGQAIAAHFDALISRHNDLLTLNISTFDFPLGIHDIKIKSDLTISPATGDVQVNNLHLKIDNTEHRINGSRTSQQLNFAVDLQSFPLDLVTPWIPALHSGELTANLTLQGSQTEPVIMGQVDTNLVYQHIPLSVNFDGSANRHKLTIDDLKLYWASAEILAEGDFTFTDQSANLSLSAKNIHFEQLKQFKAPIPETLRGTVTAAKLSLQGAIKNPGGKLTLNAGGEYQQQPFQFTGEFTKNNERIHINSADLVAKEGRAQVNGVLQMDLTQSDLQIDAHNLPLQLLELAGVSLPPTISATANTSIQINGALRAPLVTVNASISGHYQNIPFSTVFKGSHNGKISQLDMLKLNVFDENILTASGHYQTAQFDIEMAMEKLPAQLLTALGWQRPAGHFNANLNARGSLTKPIINGSLNYSTTLPGFDTQGEEKPINFHWALTAETISESLNIESNLRRENNNFGNLSASLPVNAYLQHFMSGQTDKMPLQAKLHAALDLQSIAFFIDPDLHHLSGEVRGDFSLHGTRQEPLLNGSLTIDQVNYENAVSGTILQEINCHITSQQTIVRFESCQAADGSNGDYHLSGQIHLPEQNHPGQIAVELAANKAHILQQPDIDGQITGAIALSGNFTDVVASGNLDVSPLIIHLNSSLVDNTPRIDVEEVFDDRPSTEIMPATKSQLPNVTLNLVITASQQAYLRGRGLDAELQGKIKVTNHWMKPDLKGSFTTVRGGLDLFGKHFKLQQGEINFANNSMALSIPGIYETNDQQILATVSGTDQKINVELSAIPAMSKDEILAFIIFGKTVQTITPFEAIQLASAVRTLSSDGGFDPIGKTRDILGVDTLYVRTQTNDQGEDHLNVGTGKYLSEKVYVELQHSPDPLQPWQANIRIELTPDLYLESSSGNKGVIEGIQIKWKRDY